MPAKTIRTPMNSRERKRKKKKDNLGASSAAATAAKCVMNTIQYLQLGVFILQMDYHIQVSEDWYN
jgi:hypothetical protein